MMLNDFLNVNRLAIERKHPAVAVQYDKHLWNTVQQESESGKKGVNVNELLTKVNANDVDNLIRNTKSLMDKPSLRQAWAQAAILAVAGAAKGTHRLHPTVGMAVSMGQIRVAASHIKPIINSLLQHGHLTTSPKASLAKEARRARSTTEVLRGAPSNRHALQTALLQRMIRISAIQNLVIVWSKVVLRMSPPIHLNTCSKLCRNPEVKSTSLQP